MKNLFLAGSAFVLMTVPVYSSGVSGFDFKSKQAVVSSDVISTRHGVLKYQKASRNLPRKTVSKVSGSDDLYNVVTLLDEDFSSLAEGNSENPTAVNITTSEGMIEGLPGWKGEEVYDAGGMLYVNMSSVEDPEFGGMLTPVGELITPDIATEGGKTLRVDFDLKGVPSSGEDFYDSLNVIILGLSSEVPEDKTMIDFPYVNMTGDWQHGSVEIMLPETIGLWPEDSEDEVECKLTAVRIKLQPMETPFFIDNFKVQTLEPKVAVPENLGYIGFTDSGFTAQWNAVEGADSYMVTLYSGEFDVENYQYNLSKIDEVMASTNSAKLDVDTMGLLFFTVTAISAGQPSPASEPQMVYSVMPPVLDDATGISEEKFTASWKPASGADFTEIWAYSSLTTKEAVNDYPYVTLDFAGSEDIAGDGQVMSLDDFSYGWVAMPYPYIEEGAMVLDNNSAFWTGIDAKMMSACSYDLSEIDGEVTLKVTARTTDYAGLVVASGGYDKSVGSMVTLDAEAEEDLTQEWQEYTFKLEAKNPQAMFIIQAYNLGVLQVKDVKIEVNFPEGGRITLPYFSAFTESQSVEIPMPECVYDNVLFIGRSIKDLVVEMDGEDTIIEEAVSDYSEPKYVISPSGVAMSSSDMELNDVRYYDISGRYVGSSKPTETGVYIVRNGGDTRKIVVK